MNDFNITDDAEIVIASNGDDDEMEIDETSDLAEPESRLLIADGAVFCCSAIPTKDIVAVGTQSDEFFLINYKTGEILITCKFNETVHLVGADMRSEKFVAAADMSGHVKVFSIEKSAEIWSGDVDETTQLTWHPYTARVLFASTKSGNLWMWKIPSGESKYFTGNKEQSLCTFQLMAPGTECLAAFEDGSFVQWNLADGTRSNSLPEMRKKLEDPEPTCMVLIGSVAYIGNCSGFVAVLLMDKKFQVDRMLNCRSAEQQQQQQQQHENDHCSVEAIATVPGNLIAVGTNYGDIIFWSIANYQIYSRISILGEAAVVKILPYSNGVIMAACADGTVQFVDPRLVNTDRGLKIIACDTGSLYDLCLLNSNQQVLTVAESGAVSIFKIDTSL